MKMSSTLSMRVKVLVLAGLFAFVSSCSGDKAPADEELDVSGEEAAAAPAEGEAAAPAEGEPAVDTKKAKKGKKSAKKGKKASAKKPKK
jgi:hypothetical protein